MHYLNVAILVVRNPMLYAAITPVLGVLGFQTEGLLSTLTIIGAAVSAVLGLVAAAMKELEAKRVQAALDVKPDGYMGPKTVAAAVEATAAKDVLTGPNPAM